VQQPDPLEDQLAEVLLLGRIGEVECGGWRDHKVDPAELRDPVVLSELAHGLTEILRCLAPAVDDVGPESDDVLASSSQSRNRQGNPPMRL
jgi:hypothetical protein